MLMSYFCKGPTRGGWLPMEPTTGIETFSLTTAKL